MTATLSTHDLAVDHALAEIAQSFRFLLDVTPVDADVQRAAFAADATTAPDFAYRELEDDPEVTAEMLKSIDLADVEDPMLAKLLGDKHRELELQVQMLRARTSSDFLPLSLELYGGVSPALRDRAFDLLGRAPVPASDGPSLDATSFSALAETEVEHYRTLEPDIVMHVAVRPDVAGILVSGHDLLVAETASVHASRADALLQHEVGTHLVTHVNGSHQPVQLLAAGLAGYEETQEGLAILAEFLVGGLSAFRMRQLACRVVAVDRMVAGDTFAEVHGCLMDLGFPQTSAFSTTMRAFRGGGFTKDAIYLRGVLDVVDHLRQGGALDSLWLGKFSLRDLPVVEHLYERGMLVPPRVLPRYLGRPETAARLNQAAELTDIADMIERVP
jgi:uncharacterized protein (TIGR02421 family)